MLLKLVPRFLRVDDDKLGALKTWNHNRDSCPRGLLKFSFAFYLCVVRMLGQVACINLKILKLREVKTVLPIRPGLDRFDLV